MAEAASWTIPRMRYLELRFFCAQWKSLTSEEQRLIKSCISSCHPMVSKDILALVTKPEPQSVGGKSQFFKENYRKFFYILSERKGSFDKGGKA